MRAGSFWFCATLALFTRLIVMIDSAAILAAQPSESALSNFAQLFAPSYQDTDPPVPATAQVSRITDDLPLVKMENLKAEQPLESVNTQPPRADRNCGQPNVIININLDKEGAKNLLGSVANGLSNTQEEEQPNKLTTVEDPRRAQLLQYLRQMAAKQQQSYLPVRPWQPMGSNTAFSPIENT
ncbi:hypothetical protein Ciccas_013850 [Cichlidogyrus casuarinus]|uniref:Uncharacterized protein n=1 Tax=Cichlidogyrus casuarinus TaxID=1844966 RepID=A0ABD2PLT4_9PLAT